MTEQEYSGNEELSEDEARVLFEGRKAASKTVSKLKEHKKKKASKLKHSRDKTDSKLRDKKASSEKKDKDATKKAMQKARMKSHQVKKAG